jgi:predicted nucleic acid-binding Zn ribbon protein
MSRRAPRPLGPALDAFLARLAPASTLASVQAVWATAVGAAVALHAAPIRAHDGLLTVACDEAVWASEIELMGPDLVAALNAALGSATLTAVTCRADLGAASRRPHRRKRK